MNQEKMVIFLESILYYWSFFSWKWYPMKNQKKIISVLRSIINLVLIGFHKMCESPILGTLFSAKPNNLAKKFLKSPFLDNFHNFVFLNAKFWHFLNWPYLTVDLWYKRVGNP